MTPKGIWRPLRLFYNKKKQWASEHFKVFQPSDYFHRHLCENGLVMEDWTHRFGKTILGDLA